MKNEIDVKAMVLRHGGRWYVSVPGKPGVHPCAGCDLSRLCRGPCHARRLLEMCAEVLGAVSGEFHEAGLDTILSIADRAAGL